MPELTEEFAYIVQKFGAPAGVAPSAAADLGRYAGQLPQALLDLWATHGQGLMLDGKFQFCDPVRFAPLARLIFGNDPDLPAARCHIFGYSAFGTLLVWNEDHDDIRVSLVDATASSLALTGKASPLAPDIAISLPLFQLDADVFDAYDQDGKPLFARSRKALGKLKPGQVYGFVPMLALGGSRRLENLKVVSALEHFAMLAQAAPIQLIDTSTMNARVIRPLGG